MTPGRKVYDPTFHAKAIARHFRPADFIAHKALLVPAQLNQVVADAVAVGRTGFDSVALKSSLLRGKYVYQVDDIAQNLVLRHMTSNIRRVTGVKQDDRQFIVSCLRSLLSEGVPFRVYKFDIKTFYEAVQVDEIITRLQHDIAFSGEAVRALRSFFDDLQKQGVGGLHNRRASEPRHRADF